jgi:peroxiredoxin
LELPTPSTNVVAAAGTLSAEGEATIRDLAGGNPSVVYYLYVEGQSAGVVFVDSNRATNRSEFLLPAKAGMKAPDLALVDLSSGRKFRLSDLRGQVVFIEFYTTHCAPCQPVLARLNEFVERRGEGLNGKAAILAVGLDAVLQPDSSPETVAKHLRWKKWTRLRPLVPDYAFSWEVTKRSPFGVNGVPQSFLIDREGAILWSGHPGEVNVEQKIDELLKLGAE